MNLIEKIGQWLGRRLNTNKSLDEHTISSVTAEQGQIQNLYDFLYHDAKRVGSFLSQFEPDGLPQSTARSISETAAKSLRQSGKASINATFASAGVGSNREATQTAQNTVAKTYDPIWQNALAFLEYLKRHDLLYHDIKTCPMGRFVIVSGDLGML